MTNQHTTMPEPVAWVSRATLKTLSRGRAVTAYPEKTPWLAHGLITTAQAEAYADAKVREALEWQPANTAPKDGTVFLGNFGYPCPMYAVWNEPSKRFCVANLQIDLYEHQWNDTYFENEHPDEKELTEKDILSDFPQPDQIELIPLARAYVVN